MSMKCSGYTRYTYKDCSMWAGLFYLATNASTRRMNDSTHKPNLHCTIKFGTKWFHLITLANEFCTPLLRSFYPRNANTWNMNNNNIFYMRWMCHQWQISVAKVSLFLLFAFKCCKFSCTFFDISNAWHPSALHLIFLKTKTDGLFINWISIANM